LLRPQSAVIWGGQANGLAPLLLRRDLRQCDMCATHPFRCEMIIMSAWKCLLVMIVTCMKCVGQAGGPAPPVSFSFAFSRIGLLHNRREMLIRRWTAATATTSYARASLCTP